MQRLRIHFAEKAKPGAGRGAGSRKQSGIPRWNIPKKKGGLEPKVRKGRNIDGEKPPGRHKMNTLINHI
jgi:hypothetical protein